MSQIARHRPRLRDEGKLDKGQLPGDEDFEVDVYTVADTLKVTMFFMKTFTGLCCGGTAFRRLSRSVVGGKR